jgi:hypothetical protein
MGYAAQIDSKLNQAFNLMKDLAVPVVFVKKTASYDFSIGEAVTSATTNVVTKAVIVETKKTSKESNTSSKQLMFKAKEVGDITLFDSVQINGVTWKLGDVITNSGYIILTDVFKD